MPSETSTRHLHPASLLFSIGSAAKRLLLPGIALLFVSGGRNVELWIMILFVPSALAALVRFISYRYRLADDELIVREGIITRNERHIPYARVQNIDLVRNPLHRLLGVAEVHVETAGGQKPEAVIRVLSLQAIEQMRARVFAGERAPRFPDAVAPLEPRGDGSTAQDEAGRALLQLPARELALHGIISNRGMVVVAAALGALSQFDPIERWLRDWEPGVPEALPGAQWLDRPLGLTLIAIGALLIALLLLRAFSVVLALVRLHGFQLRRRGEDLRADYGLLTRISKTIPRHRIQLLTTVETPLHRWFGRSAVRVETAGSADDNDAGAADRLTIAPLVRRDALGPLLQEILPDAGLERIEWRPLAPKATGRVFRRFLGLAIPPCIGAVAASIVTGLLFPLAVLAVLPLGYLHARRFVRHSGYAVLSGAVAYRSGWWTRRMSVARFGKIQAVLRASSPFDRRLGMASVAVDTAAGGRARHPIAIPYLEAAVAEGLERTLVREAGSAAFRW